MHETYAGNANVPAFLLKLWKLVSDASSDELISWSEHGHSFIIHDQSRFAQELLPLYYKHNNNASFVRQLNMYGFRKVMNLEQGGLKSDGNSVEFQHPYFIMGQEILLQLIKRKISAPKDDVTRCRSEIINQVVDDLNSLKHENSELKAEMVQKDRENEVVWRELASLKQKYRNHQQMLNKLLQFLVRWVPSNRGIKRGVKRKMPLMIEHSDTAKDARSRKISTFSDDSSITSPASQGPVIHDITDADNDVDLQVGLKPNHITESTVSRSITPPPSEELNLDASLNVEPLSVFDPLNVDGVCSPTNEDILDEISGRLDLSKDNQMKEMAIPGTSQDQSNNMSVAVSEIPSLQIPEDAPITNLDWLKDQLMNSGGYNIDAGYLLSLLSPGDVPGNTTLSPEQKKSEALAGNEVVQYDGGEIMFNPTSPLPDLSLFDSEFSSDPVSSSTMSIFNPELDEILGLTETPKQKNTDETLSTPEINDDLNELLFSKPSNRGKGKKQKKTGKKSGK